MILESPLLLGGQKTKLNSCGQTRETWGYYALRDEWSHARRRPTPFHLDPI